MTECCPLALVTVSVTFHVPLLLGKLWNGLGALLDGEPSPKFHNHAVIGQPAGADERSVNVMFRRGLPEIHVKLGVGAAQGVGVGVGVAVGVAVAVAVEVGVGVGVEVGVGVVAGGTVTVRIAVRLPPWFVTWRVTV